jgi:dihydropyrimidine dehydrogenase (NAD+) subunit PreA
MHMVADIARDPECQGLAISGIGGISNWHDAAEFISLGASTVQVCTAAMHHGFRIVEDMTDGLNNWMDSRDFADIRAFTGMAIPNYVHWQDLNLNYKIVANIDQDACIKCGLCHIACEDTAHQAVGALRIDGARRYEIIEEECVGCNLCMHVCPVENCITMQERDEGKPFLTWQDHPNNPMRRQAAE